jgi:hypothetical protein
MLGMHILSINSRWIRRRIRENILRKRESHFQIPAFAFLKALRRLESKKIPPSQQKNRIENLL